jgi:CubicO group peptidase (beta-lactamase class C family)
VKLEHKPGMTSDYSNLGMGLLGHILALRAGKSFKDLVKESICEPLGMHDTALKLNESQSKRLVPGHDNEGKPASNWTFDVLAPAGGLKSTLDDMMAFVKANIEGTKEPLQTDLLLAQQKHYSSLLETVGLGWNSQWFASGLTAHWHNGGTGGYSSFMAFSKDHKTGVVLLYNVSEAETEKLDTLGINVLKWATKISLEK